MLYKPVWEFVSVDEYKRPAVPTRENVRTGLSALRDAIHPVSRYKVMQRKELHRIPPYLLNRVAPEPGDTPMVNALISALQGWQFSREPGDAVQVVVGPPGSSIAQAVTSLAQSNGWQIVGPPTSAQILDGGDAWLSKFSDEKLTPLVIPRLGKCFIRHQEGLVLLIRLLEWMQSTRRRCLVACDSWAWAYLVKALQIDVMLPTPLTLAPFDGAHCQFWLPSLASRIHKGRFSFRDMSSGQLLFPMAERYFKDMEHLEDQEAVYGNWVGVSYFVRHLAAYGRGLPAVIWEVWRQCLQVGSDLVAKNGADIRGGDKGYTVWVQSWSQVKLPIVPTPVGTDECFVLHTILLHGGMTTQLLADLLPLSYNEVRRIVHFFWDAGLLEKQEGSWQVRLLAYPTVRQFLAHEGYLVDHF